MGIKEMFSAPFTRTKQPPILLLVLAGIAATCFFSYQAWAAWSNDEAQKHRGEQTTARVVSVGKRLSVEFQTADGQQARAAVDPEEEFSPRPKTGDEIPIVYDPRNPTADVRDVRVPETHGTAKLYLLFAILPVLTTPAAIAVAIVRKVRRGRDDRGRYEPPTIP